MYLCYVKDQLLSKYFLILDVDTDTDFTFLIVAYTVLEYSYS